MFFNAADLVDNCVLGGGCYHILFTIDPDTSQLSANNGDRNQIQICKNTDDGVDTRREFLLSTQTGNDYNTVTLPAVYA